MKPPKYDAQAFASALLERCDSDGSGSLSKSEVDHAPGIRTAWSKYDLDGNGIITRDELQARIERWIASGDGLVPITCEVRLGGRRIGEQQVKLIPNEALEAVIQPAWTISDVNQATFLVIPPELKLEEHQRLTGMQYGLYRVEVSHPSMKLAPTETSRGCDIGQSDQGAPIIINVVAKSR